MRTMNFMKTGLLIFAASMGLAACSDDEKTPEVVVDPVEETIEYYIEGKVTADGAALKDVTVSAEGLDNVKTDANGLYSLTVGAKKTYKLTFALDGYMASQESYDAVVADNATNRSIVTVNAVLNKMGETVKVTEKLDAMDEADMLVISEKGSEVTEKTENTETGATETTEPVAAAVAVAVSKNAIVKEEGQAAPEISVTPYVPVNTAVQAPSETPKKLEASLVNLKIESNVPVTVQEPVTVQISAVSGNTNTEVVEAETFEEVKVYRKVDSDGKSARAIGDIVNGWKEIGTAVFHAATKSYAFVIAAGERLDGEFSARIEPTVTVGKTQSKVIAEGSKSNAGNMAAIDFTFGYEAPTGWAAAIAANISDNTKSQLLSTITSYENGAEGITNVKKEMTAKISGNYNLYYKVSAKYVEKTYTFKLKGSEVDVNVTNYNGTDFTYQNVNADQHSGGGSK